MTNSEKDTKTLSLSIASDVALVNDAIKQVREFLKKNNTTDESSIVLVLRELLNNAVEHGNAKNKELEVSVEMETIGPNRFKMSVEDMGPGFDYASMDLSMPDDPTQIRNRGLSLVNSFVDQLEFNKKGNKATVYITVSEQTGFEINDEDGFKVVVPSGDLTAEIADKFRLILLNLLEDGFVNYKFDMKNVEDIDSIALSIFVVFSNMVRKANQDSNLIIYNAAKDIVNLFQITRLSTTYEIQ